jgi:hypothetical protein
MPLQTERMNAMSRTTLQGSLRVKFMSPAFYVIYRLINVVDYFEIEVSAYLTN